MQDRYRIDKKQYSNLYKEKHVQRMLMDDENISFEEAEADFYDDEGHRQWLDNEEEECRRHIESAEDPFVRFRGDPKGLCEYMNGLPDDHPHLEAFMTGSSSARAPVAPKVQVENEEATEEFNRVIASGKKPGLYYAPEHYPMLQFERLYTAEQKKKMHDYINTPDYMQQLENSITIFQKECDRRNQEKEKADKKAKREQEAAQVKAEKEKQREEKLKKRQEMQIKIAKIKILSASGSSSSSE
jgi:hypothetical protein